MFWYAHHFIVNNIEMFYYLLDSLRSCLRRLLVLYHEINLGKVNYYELTFFDNKIMVVIVILLKLIYRLDDNFE